MDIMCFVDLFKCDQMILVLNLYPVTRQARRFYESADATTQELKFAPIHANSQPCLTPYCVVESFDPDINKLLLTTGAIGPQPMTGKNLRKNMAYLKIM